MTWAITDLECENYEYYGSLASPHDPRNYIVAAGWAIDGGDIQHEYFDTPDGASKSDWFKRMVDGQKVLVAHNATFEIHWFLKYYYDDFMAFIRRGGRVYCTQYAEFLLTHQTELYPKLEDCAVKRGGTKKVDEVKMLWEAGYKTSEIDKALLLDYLISPEHGDIANTRRVAFSQVAELKQKGMMPMMWIRMDSLLFNAIATFNGLYVDMDVAKTNQAEQEHRIAEIQSQVKDLLPDDLPSDFEFSFTSPYHMSAFLFGGGIKYKTQVSYDPIKYEQIEAFGYVAHNDPEDIIYRAIDDGDIPVRYELIRFKAGKNKGLPKVFKIDSDVEKTKWGEALYNFTGLIDLTRLPPVVQEQFLGKRAEFRGKRLLGDGKTPVYSTGKEVLDILATHKVAVAAILKELAALLKDTGTYYLQVDKSGKQSGMLQFVEPNGIIHHQLNNCATITGRLSSSKPNLQNVPRDGTSKVKQMFTSRFGKQGRIVEVDYSALEVVALAAISGDMNLMQALLDGIDMHCYRLAGALGENYDDVYEKCHNQDHPDHKRYKQMRTDIKPRAFANQYGASAYGIALSTGCTLEEAELFKETELKLFPESTVFAERFVRPVVEATGFETPIERELNERGEWKTFRRGYFTAKGGTRYSFRQYPKMVEGKEYYDYKPTQLANYWCQGEASFIVQAACGRVIRQLIAEDFACGLVVPINTVHDALYLDCATEELATKYGKLTQQIMEDTPRWLAEMIPEYKDWRYDTTPFPAAAEMGENMMDKRHIA